MIPNGTRVIIKNYLYPGTLYGIIKGRGAVLDSYAVEITGNRITKNSSRRVFGQYYVGGIPLHDCDGKVPSNKGRYILAKYCMHIPTKNLIEELKCAPSANTL